MLYKKLNVVLAISSALTASALPINAFAANVQHTFNDNNNVQTTASSSQIAKPYQMRNLNNELGKTTVQWFDKKQSNNADLNFVVDKKAQIQKAGNTAFANIASKHGYLDNGASDSVISQIHDTGKGPVIVKYKQQVNGVDVIGSEINIIMTQQLGLIASTGTFATISGSAQPQSSSIGQTAKNAILKAYLESNVTVNAADLEDVSTDNGFETFKVVNQPDFVDGKSWAVENAAAKFVYYPTGRGVEAAYMVNVSMVDSQTQESDMQGYFISARDLRVLHKGSLKANHAYRYKVYADATSPYRPFDTPTSIEASPYPNGVDPHAYGLYTDHLVEDQYVSVVNAGLSTNDPWLAPYQVDAIGNNVRAMADVVAPEGFTVAKEGDPQRDFYLTTSAAGTFNYSYDYGLPASDPHNIRSAMTQLFFVNNYMHDIWYDAGFDEASGNAQFDNYGRGGLGNDALEARVDFNGANNASMETPPDGQTPVMRMYTWGLYELLFDVRGLIGQAEGDVFSPDRFGRSVFGPSTFEMKDDPETEIVENELAYAYDGEGVSADLCEPVINAEEIAGKIAVIERGTCSFLQKSLHAQKAGAVGYFVHNHVKQGQENGAGQIGGVINMGLGPNDDASDIEIPGVFLSYEDAENVLASLDAGNSVTFDVVVKTDQNHSAFDTSIVSHEWGHYLTNRLIHNGFGLMQWQGASLGEGWSDFIAMMLQLKESDRNILGNELFQGDNPMSTFVGRNLIGNISFKEGIRRYPYTTNMVVNPLTLGHIAFSAELPREVGTYYNGQYIPNNEVHAAGEVWAVALWEVYIALHNERRDLSFDMIETRMKEYLVASLKVTPYWPTYVEARDAILAVAAATDEKDFDIMVSAFARRGFGLGAIAPERTDALFEQVVESFATSYPAFSVEGITADYQYIGEIGAYCDIDESFDVGETVKITMLLKDLSREPFTGTKAIINSIDDITISQNGVAIADNVLSIDFAGDYGAYVDFSFEITLNSAQPMSTVRFDLEFENSEVDAILPPSGIAWMNAETDIVANQHNLTRFEDNIAVEADWASKTENVSEESFGVAVFPWLLDSKFGSDALDIRQEQMFWGGASPTRAFTVLESPEIEVNESGEFKFEFFHVHEFEVAQYRAADAQEDDPWILEYWDGGVIEVSVDGGEWHDITTLNAHMSSPYTGVLHGTFPENEARAQNPLGYRLAYTGSTGPKGEHVTITVPEGQVNGKKVRVRFAIGTDEQFPTLGWFIDDFEFFNTVQPAFSIAIAERGESCSNRVPMIQTVNRITVNEKDNAGNQTLISTSATALEFDNEAVTFEWTQLSGPSADFEYTADGSLSFMAPVINRNSLLEFEVTATDASGNQKSEIVEITLIDINVAPTSQGSDITVKEGSLVVLTAIAEDLDGDYLAYQWQQVAGDTVEYDGGKSESIDFVAPNITETTTLSFEMTASDSEKSTTSTYTVTIEPYSSNVGDSGSFGWMLGVFTLMFAIRQRYALTVSNNK